MTGLNELTATEAARRIHDGEATCEAVVTDCILRIEAREPDVRAWEYLDPEYALDQARAIDAGPRRGPLHGVPVGIKDIYDTVDMPTTHGSPIYRGNRPAMDAAAVAMLRAAGALILGKTVSTEFAASNPSKTRNPHNIEHTPAGSSSGSAAAVADMMVPAALGSQTAGSVIRPAAFCGTVGYKATFGILNRRGLAAQAESLDTIGCMTRCVDDLALLTAVLTCRTPPPPGQMPDRKPRIGLCRTHLWRDLDPAAVEATEDAAARLAAAGAEVRECALPAHFADITEVQWSVLAVEASRAYAHEWNNHREALSAKMRAVFEQGWSTPDEDYVAALAFGERCRAEFASIIEGHDLLLAPSAQGEAPHGLDWTGDVRFQTMWSFLRVPAITLPTHTGPNNMPVGNLLVGPAHGDRALFDNARWAESVLMQDGVPLPTAPPR